MWNIICVCLFVMFTCFLGCDEKNNQFPGFFGPGNCSVVYTQTATFDASNLPLPLDADAHNLALKSSDCPFWLSNELNDQTLTIDMVTPFELILSDYKMTGEVIPVSPGRFGYDAKGGPFESKNNANCMAEFETVEGRIDVDGNNVILEAEVALWLEWYGNGPGCGSLDLF